MRSARWLALPAAVWIAVAPLALTPSTSSGQAYPARPVRIIVPFAPGGATDIVTRVIAPRLTDIWGQTVVVDNRGGAAGNIGAELAAKATPDGHTLFLPSGSVGTANQHIYRKISSNAEKDFIAITNVASGPQIVAVANNVAAKDLKELITLAKAKPRSMTFGSAGIGSQTHLAAENFLYTAGIDAIHVPVNG